MSEMSGTLSNVYGHHELLYRPIIFNTYCGWAGLCDQELDCPVDTGEHFQYVPAAETTKFYENEIWLHPCCWAHNLKMSDVICNIQIAMGRWHIISLISEIWGPYHLQSSQNVTVIKELLWPGLDSWVSPQLQMFSRSLPNPGHLRCTISMFWSTKTYIYIILYFS